MTLSPITPPINIDQHTLSHMLLCAFRYSLGRMSHITGECVDWLIRYWDIMPPAWKRQIHGDIEKAIEQGCAGMDCDIVQWRRLLTLPLPEDAP